MLLTATMKVRLTLFILSLAGFVFMPQGASSCELPSKGAAPLAFLTGARAERLEFSFKWQGLALARGEVEFKCASEGADGFHLIRATLTTRRWASWLWPSNHSAQSMISPENFLPKHYLLVKRDRSGQQRMDIAFDHIKKRALLSASSNERSVEKLIPFEIAYDPLALLFYARTAQMRRGEAKTVELFTGDRKYRVSFMVGSSETIEVKAGRFEAEEIRAQFVRLSDQGGEKGKIKHAAVWFSANAERLPLKVEIKARLGQLIGELTSFSRY